MIEWVVWRVPEPIRPSEHGFKYRAAYAIGGVRVVGFDNERGKGDHCHMRGAERRYTFVSVEQLIEDFIAAVGVVCPFDAVHIDMRLTAPHPLAA